MTKPGRPRKYLHVMEPHKVRFPSFLWNRAVALARSQGELVTAADVVREALAVYLNLHEIRRSP